MTASAPEQTVTFSKSHAVSLGERVSEPPGAAVRIAVQLERGASDRLPGSRKRPERAFVGRELDDALEPVLALDLLDRLAGLVRNEPGDGTTDHRRIDVAGPTTHVAGRGSGPGGPARRRRSLLSSTIASTCSSASPR